MSSLSTPWENNFLLVVGFYTIMSFIIFLLRQQLLNVAVFFLFQTTSTKAEMEQDEVSFITEENALLYDEPFAEKKSDSITMCSQYCARQKRCKSANFVKEEKICSLLDKTRITHPALLLQEQIGVTHLEKVFSFIFHYTRLHITRELHENHWETPGCILHLLSTCLVLQYLLFSKVVQYITSFFLLFSFYWDPC